jgi:predicted MarR family transcription regulator
VLTGLESLELVQRLENPRDGRQVLVQITPLGANRMSEYVRARELWLEQQLAALSPSDRDLLRQATKLLDQLAAFQPLPQQAESVEAPSTISDQWPAEVPHPEPQHSQPQHA